MIRLIISDIDGTLAPEGAASINPEYMDIIRRLHDSGIQFALSSGRQASSMDAVFHEVQDLVYYLSDNGASIQKHGETIQETCMCPSDLIMVLKEALAIPDCHAILSTRDGCYTNSADSDFLHLVFEEYRLQGHAVENLTDYADKCIKLSLYGKTGSKRLHDLLYDHWKDTFAVTISGARWLDFNDFRSSKGNAVQWLQRELSITPAETAAFGDNFNDISMFHQAEWSYASVLSHPDVQKAAKYTVASYEEDGVLQVLKQILAGGS